MAALSTYLSDKLLNATLNGTSYSTPATVYVALGTTNQAAGNTWTEVTGGSYARQALTFGTAAAAESIANTVAATFTSMPSCTVVSVSIYDASTSGNLLYFDNITGQVVNSGGTFSVPIGGNGNANLKDTMENTFIILGINGTDATADTNTATVRLFDASGNPNDQEFALPALSGADPTIAPTNYEDTYLPLITPAIETALAQLTGGGTLQ